MSEIPPVRPEVLKKLYSDIGGEASLEEILTLFYQRMAADTMIGFFFYGKDLPTIIQNQKKFLMKVMGELPDYKGKTPATAHLELPPILEGHFDRRLVILKEVLEKWGANPWIIRTWISFERQFRKVVVASHPH